jgi:hypothetical protein
LVGALTGCGSRQNTTTTPVTPASTTVDGAAVKGTVKNAIVTVNEIGGTNNPIAVGKTNDDGSYNLPAVSNYKGGPIEIDVQGRKSGDASGVTQLRCDAPKCGKDAAGADIVRGTFYDVDENFLLQTCKARLVAGSNEVNATPLTNLVADRAQTLAGVGNTPTAANIAGAISQVNQLSGGIDVINTRPVDLSTDLSTRTLTPQQIAYGGLIAAVQRAVDTTKSAKGSGGGLKATLDQFKADFNDSAGVDPAKLKAFVKAARDSIADAKQCPGNKQCTDNSGATSNLDTQANSGTRYKPDAIQNANDDAIKKAKSFMSDIRTTAQSVKTASDTTNTAFYKQIDTSAKVANPAAKAVLQSVSFAIGQALDFSNANSSAPTAPKSILTKDKNGDPQTAIITLSDSGNTRTATITGQVNDTQITNISATLPKQGVAATGTGSYTATLSGTAKTVGTAGVKLTIKPATGSGSAATVTINVVDGSKPINDKGANNESGSNIKDATLNADILLEQIGGPDGVNVTFEGKVIAAEVTCTRTSCNETTDKQITLGLLSLDLFGEFRDGSSDKLSASVNFVQDASTAANFDPQVSYSASNFVKGVLTVSFDATVPNIPRTQAIVVFNATGASNAATGQKNGVPIGSVTVTLNRSNALFLTISTSNSAAKTTPDTLTISNAAGASLIVNRDSADNTNFSGVLNVDGVRAGKVTTSKNIGPRITYDDGTFESFN